MTVRLRIWSAMRLSASACELTTLSQYYIDTSSKETSTEDVLNLKLWDSYTTSYSQSSTDEFSVGASKIGLEYFHHTDGELPQSFEAEWDFPSDETAGNVDGDVAFFDTENLAFVATILEIGDARMSVDSLSWQATSSYDASSNRIENPTSGELQLTRTVDRSTTGFLLAAAQQRFIAPTIRVIEYIQVGDDVRESSIWTLHDPRITHFSLSGTVSSNSNTLDFEFSKIEVQRFDYSKSNQVGNSRVSWDVSKSSVEFEGNGFGQNQVPGNSDSEQTVLTFPDGSELEVTNFQWSLDRTSSESDVEFDSMDVSAMMDRSGPALIANLAGLRQTSPWTINRYSKVSDKIVEENWTLHDVGVTRVNVALGSPEAWDFSLAFSKVELNSQNSETNWVDQHQQTSGKVASFGTNDGLDVPIVLDLHDGPGGEIELQSFSFAKAENLALDFQFSTRDFTNAASLMSSVADDPWQYAKVTRRTRIDDQWETDYEVQFYDFHFRSFDVTVDTLGGTVSFGFTPDQATFDIYRDDPDSHARNRSKIEWDFDSGEVTSNLGGLLGDSEYEPNEAVAPDEKPLLIFPDHSKIELESFSTSLHRPVSDPLVNGDRPLGPSDPGEHRLDHIGLSPSLLSSFATNNSTHTLRILNRKKSKLDTTDSNEVRLLDSTVSGLTFSDSPSSGSFSTVDFESSGLRYEANQFDGIQDKVTTWDWDISTDSVSSTGGLGTTEAGLSEEDLPPSYLRFVDSDVVVEVADVTSWSVSNAVLQTVGKGQAGQRAGGERTTFSLSIPLGGTTPGLAAKLTEGESLRELQLVSSGLGPKGKGIREWTLSDVYVSQLSLDNTSLPSSNVGVRLDVGKIETRTVIQEDGSASGENEGLLASTESVFASSLDFITPPASDGLPAISGLNLHTESIELTDYFTDEQQTPGQLRYRIDGNSNPDLFTSIQLTSGQLSLTLNDDARGSAELLVTAIDAFGLERTEILSVENYGTDFGDAPAPFPTTLADNGPRHETRGPRLGDRRDHEPEGSPAVGAIGDEDEDGVQFGAIVLGNEMAGVNIDLQNASEAFVDAWLDFDQNGIWEPDEKILHAVPVQEVDGFQTLNFDINDDAIAGQVIARVRVSSAGGLATTGPTSDGEVEDYSVLIVNRPTVNQIIVNDGRASRSQLTELTIEFDTLVNHDTIGSAITITNLTTNEQVGTVLVDATDEDNATAAVLTFDGSSTIPRDLGNSLADGNYRLDIDADRLQHGLAAVTMENDFVFGGQTSNESPNDHFFRFFGDGDGDRDVDGQDYGRFASAFLKSAGDAE
ncbi:MAG: type VI secretion system tube protein Hcp, partial [Planctomycetota bacterium]